MRFLGKTKWLICFAKLVHIKGVVVLEIFQKREFNLARVFKGPRLTVFDRILSIFGKLGNEMYTLKSRLDWEK